ncbi:V-type proton ATPase subunit C 1-like [Gracilinanus agilis]|uniref:V-type proton ATPase subunit C 1-like n=1 Tax=Gracilinanus agilis TaxID=191870 RepID=UPI001CFD5D94|nr:V-type proton ATPase subunit C 1-like [Gracilinanus agilis]
MTEFWLISAPAEKTCQETWERLQAATLPSNLSSNVKFNIPQLKVGILDVLVELSDDLKVLDEFVAKLHTNIATYVSSLLLGDVRDKIGEILLAKENDIITYITNFQWDLAKFPITESMRVLYEMIKKEVHQIDNDFNSRTATYEKLKENVNTMEKKQEGGFLTKSLAQIVKKEDFVLDSEYLVTILVVVSKANYEEWVKHYETLSDFVVPRSSRIISQDSDNYLCNVTLFKKVVNYFTTKAKERNFFVREFSYDEERMKKETEALSTAIFEKKKYFGPLFRWLQLNFSEAFISWIHVKALRVYVESVLRYGLPVNFQAMLLRPNEKNKKRLREVLNDLYRHLMGSSVALVADTSSSSVSDYDMDKEDYYPYVYFKIDCTLS